MHIMDFLDWLHIGWRLRRVYLDPAKALSLGGLIISHAAVAGDPAGFKLNQADVDARNKQSYTGAPGRGQAWAWAARAFGKPVYGTNRTSGRGASFLMWGPACVGGGWGHSAW